MGTPLKTNMEPENVPTGKEIHRPKPSILGFHVTPLKTNISPENQWLEDVFPIDSSSLLRGHVNFPGCSFRENKILDPSPSESWFLPGLVVGEGRTEQGHRCRHGASRIELLSLGAQRKEGRPFFFAKHLKKMSISKDFVDFKDVELYVL